MPKRVESLGEAVERRVHLHARPQKIDNLLPVQRMLRARGQQLREHLSAPPLPLGDGSGRVTALYPKAAEQAHVEDGGPLSPVAGRSQRAHLRHLNPPPVLAQDTSFGRVVPTGAGVVSFSTLDEAAAGVDQVFADYPRHAAAGPWNEELIGMVLVQVQNVVVRDVAERPATKGDDARVG